MIRVISKGDWHNTFDWMRRILKGDLFGELDRFGRMGVEALAKATPVDTGITANSWYYRIKSDQYGHSIEWHNDNVVNNTPLVILLQYGHGTGTGGYVQGRDFINPALRPIMDQIANEIWKKVTA